MTETEKLESILMRPKWDKTWMDIAKVMSERSKDSSSQVGAVIVAHDKIIISTAYNGLPRGVDDQKHGSYGRPEKYFWFEHAERNAIFNAARHGHKTMGCVIYVSGLPPCADCARAIIQAGIIEVVVDDVELPERWASSMAAANKMLQNAGIPTRRYHEHS